MNRYTNKDKHALGPDPWRELAACPPSTQASGRQMLRARWAVAKGRPMPQGQHSPRTQTSRHQKLFSPRSHSTSPTLIQLRPVKLYHSDRLLQSSYTGLNLHCPPSGTDARHGSTCLACRYRQVVKACCFRKKRLAFPCLPLITFRCSPRGSLRGQGYPQLSPPSQTSLFLYWPMNI